MRVKNEGELEQLGLTINSVDSSQDIRVAGLPLTVDPDGAQPNGGQSDDDRRPQEGSQVDDNTPPSDGGSGGDHTENSIRELFDRALSNLRDASALQARAAGFLRKTTLHVFEAGRALNEACQLLKSEQRWCEWLQQYGIARSTAWEAVELFRRAKKPSAIANLQITEAKIKFGIQKPREKAHGTATADTDSNTVGLARKSRGSSTSGTTQSRMTTPLEGHPNADSATTAVTTLRVADDDSTMPTADAAYALPPLDDAFVMRATDEDAFLAFVEQCGGLRRAAQVFQAAWRSAAEKARKHTDNTPEGESR